ncbi:MAG: helix-turn-helix domain-containing protein [Candidatus Binataceae bacterium]
MAVEGLLVPERIHKLTSSVFTTDQPGVIDRFEAWRESIGVIFEVEPGGKEPPPGFRASVRSYDLGEILVSSTNFGAERFKRDLRKVSSDGIDHYMVQVYQSGSLVGSTKRNDMNVRPGDIQIIDLGQPHTSTVQNSSTINVVVRRDVMAEMLPARADLHGMVLPGDRGAGGLLADYMRSLFARMESVDAVEAPFIAHATVNMMAACFQPSAYANARARAQIEGTIVDRLKRYIDENLAARDLSADALCGRFRISRTQLYRMFEPLGGVASYIQARRLDCAFAQLRDPLYQHRRVFEIAFNAGFSSIAHFSGVFRKQFGFSPSDLRAAPHPAAASANGRANPGRAGEGYEEWLKRSARRLPAGTNPRVWIPREANGRT